MGAGVPPKAVPTAPGPTLTMISGTLPQGTVLYHEDVAAVPVPLPPLVPKAVAWTLCSGIRVLTRHPEGFAAVWQITSLTGSKALGVALAANDQHVEISRNDCARFQAS